MDPRLLGRSAPQVEKALSIGQDPRPTMRIFPERRVKRRDIRWNAPGGRDLLYPATKAWRKDNHSRTPPTPPAPLARIANCLRRTPIRVYLLELSTRKKSHGTAVIRPEYKRCVARPHHRPCPR